MEFLEVIILGIIEGLTEWLPISSTGHLIIAESLFSYFNLSLGGPNFWNFFLVFIQFAAILAVIVYFFRELWPWSKSKSKEQRKEIYWTWLYILIACLPAGILGLILNDLLDQYLYNYITVTVTLIVYGVAFIVIELLLKKFHKAPTVSSLKDFTWKTALIIGIAQVLSLIPGTSRSGITILAALLIGCNRETSAKFSFYVSIPIMVAASLFEGIKFFVSEEPISSMQWGYLAVGAVVAFIVSLLAIKFLTAFVKKHTFIGFGVYRIVLGVVLVILFVTLFNNPGQMPLMSSYLLLSFDGLKEAGERLDLIPSNFSPSNFLPLQVILN